MCAHILCCTEKVSFYVTWQSSACLHQSLLHCNHTRSTEASFFFWLPQPLIQAVVSEHLDLQPMSKSPLRDMTVVVHPCEASTILKIIVENPWWETWDEQVSNSRLAAPPLEHFAVREPWLGAGRGVPLQVQINHFTFQGKGNKPLNNR